MTTPTPPGWLTAVVGPVHGAAPIRWGFTNESWAATTAEGRRLVVTRLADPRSAARLLARGPAVVARLAAAGIPSPLPIAELSDPGRSVVVSDFLAGASGMASMTDAAGAALVGRALGDAWSALQAVDPSGLGLDDRWSRPGDLAAAALEQLEAITGSLDGGPAGDQAVARMRAGLASLPGLLAGRAIGFVHGDLVPANVLLADGRLAALLDLETVRVGVGLLDAAWFRWIVRYHHPSLEPPAWTAFVAASGLDGADATMDAILEILPVARILEILSDAGLGPAARSRWQEQLRVATEAIFEPADATVPLRGKSRPRE